MNWWGLLLFMAIPIISSIIAMLEECSWQSVFISFLVVVFIETAGGIAFLIIFY